MISSDMVKSIRLLLMVLFLATGFCLSPFETSAEDCADREIQGTLLYQQFKKGKVCEDSGIGEGWSKCVFGARGTHIILQMTTKKGRNDHTRKQYVGGFKVLSANPAIKVGLFAGSHLGLIVRVEEKEDDPESGRCLFDEAYITLGSDVISPKELSNIIYGPLPPSDKRKEQTKRLQKNLTILGYSPGPIDGILGPTTKAAFEEYKNERLPQAELADEEIFLLIAIDAFFKGLVELEKTDMGTWEPGSRTR